MCYKQKSNYVGWQGPAGILRKIRSQRSKIIVVHDLVPFLLTSPNLYSSFRERKEVMLMFLLKEPSNSSPPSEIPTSLRDYNGKKLNLPSPKTGSAHTKLVLSLVPGQEQRGKGALPSFALHLLPGRVLQKEIFHFTSGRGAYSEKKLHGNSFRRRSEKARCLLT